MSSIEDLQELMTVKLKQLYYPEDDLTKTPYALDVDTKIYKDNNGDLYLIKPEVDPTTQDIKTDINGNPIYDNTNTTSVNDLPTLYPGDTGTALKNFVMDKALEYNGGDIFGNSEVYIENTYPYLNKKISTDNEGVYGRGSINDVFKYFYSQFFSTTEFDVNGYSLIFLYPPDFSGFKKLNQSLQSSITDTTTNVEGTVDFNYMPPDYAFYKYFRNYMMFAIEFDIPEQEITVSDIQLANKQNIEFVSGFNTSGNLSVRYIDNSYLQMYKFHSNWISYMKMIMRGDLEPADEYIDSKEIDYMSSMYILKFTPNMDIPNYIGKASGIFPKNLPIKELLGTRTENQLIMYNINYFYSMYEGGVLTYNNDESIGGIKYEDTYNNGFMIPKLIKPNAIYDEFNQLIMSAYSKSVDINAYRSAVDPILPGSMYDYKPFV